MINFIKVNVHVLGSYNRIEKETYEAYVEVGKIIRVCEKNGKTRITYGYGSFDYVSESVDEVMKLIEEKEGRKVR